MWLCQSEGLFLLLTYPDVVAHIMVSQCLPFKVRLVCALAGLNVCEGDGHHTDDSSNYLSHHQMGDDLLSTEWDNGRRQNKAALLSFPHLPFICMYKEEQSVKAICWAGWHDHSCTLARTVLFRSTLLTPSDTPSLGLQPLPHSSSSHFSGLLTLKNTKSNVVCDQLALPARSSWNIRWKMTKSRLQSTCFGLTEPPRLNRSPERKIDRVMVRWDEVQPWRCLICVHSGIAHKT